jgi:DNA polymerase-3 subunit delta'
MSQASDAFQGIIGHAGAVKRLRLMSANGRLPHALLLTGPRHVGKKTLAAALVASVLGVDDPGRHPDFRSLERGRDEKTDKLRKNIGIDDVREVQAFIRMSPLSGSRKAVLIDGAEYLSEEAANALLKILEEPPPSSLIILVAKDIASVPATVRSRAALVPLRRVAEAEIIRALEAEDVSESEAIRLARFAAGRPGVALALRRDAGMMEWYAAEDARWNRLQSAPLHRRFALISDLAPSGADREETALKTLDVISFWEEALRQELRRGSAAAPARLRALGRLRESLRGNVQPKALIERFLLRFDA